MAEELRKIPPEELQQILAEHKKWLDSDGKEGKQADLSQVDLSYFNISAANLSHANLGRAKLSRVVLSNATLSEADLSGAILERATLSEADLSGAILERANLSGAILERANLNEANSTEANLGWANLTGANLSGANLRQANLRQANLRQANLHQANLHQANLHGTYLKDTQFDNTNLIGCRFLHSNISDAKLINITWSSSKELGRFRHKRRIIYDEVEANDKVNSEYVGDIYRQLKIYYENKRDFAEAGDFGYGQMEMKRKSMTGLTKRFCSLYKIFSGYGEMPSLAAIWILLFLLLFPLTYMYNGIKPRTLTSNLELIHYDLSLSLPNWQAVCDFGGAFIHALQVATIQKDKAYQSYNHLGRFLEILEVILFPVQITLLVLALKRKFRR